jgi:hypothetical protein
MTRSPDRRSLLCAAALLALPRFALAAPTPIALENPSFDAPGDGLAGWHAQEHATLNSYRFTLDRDRSRSKPASARLERVGKEPWGMLAQVVQVKPEWVGKTVRFSGWLRTAGATGTGGALILQATTGGGSVMVHDHMDGRRVRGDQDWKQVASEIKVPPGAYFLKVAVMLEDDGTLWADDLKLELLD